MGIFSTKTKRFVDTQVQRVIEDNLIPSVLNTAVYQAIFDDSDLVPAIQDSALHGSFRNFERMYRFAERGDYFYSLPNARFLSSTAGVGPARAAIRQDLDISGPFTVEYLHFRPLNNIHEGFRYITHTLDYDPQSNELPVYSQQRGVEVFLTKLVAVHRVANGETLDPNAVGHFGNQSPVNQIINRPGANLLLPTDPVAPVDNTQVQGVTLDHEMRTGPDETESVEIHYHWVDTNNEFQEAVHILDLSGFNPEEEFYHAKVTYTNNDVEVVGYWTYNPTENRFPDLDTLYSSPSLIDPGTYFPFVVFRSEQEDRSIDDGSNRFASTQKLLEIIGGDFEELGQALSDTDGIEDVRQAVMMMGVPITTQDPIEMEYLWRYFHDVSERLLPAENNQRIAPLVGRNSSAGGATPESYAIQITDADFLGTISFDRITTSLRGGSIGSVGTCTNEIEAETLINPQLFALGSGFPIVGRQVRIFRRQINEHVYQEIRVTNPQFRYNIRYRLTTEGGVDDDRFLVPLDFDVCRQMNSFKRESLYHRSLHFVFNSYVEQKVKWYQRGAFGILLQVVAVVITIYTFGAGWKATLAAAAAAGGTSAAITALINIVVTSLFKALVFEFAFTQLVEVLGIEFAYWLALAAAIAGGISALRAGGLITGSLATNLLTASTGLTKGVQNRLGEMIQDYQDDLEEFQSEAEALTDELRQVQEELDAGIDLDPFTFIAQPMIISGEPPDAYFHRTIHNGNPGADSLSIIENYVDLSLRLPMPDETTLTA